MLKEFIIIFKKINTYVIKPTMKFVLALVGLAATVVFAALAHVDANHETGTSTRRERTPLAAGAEMYDGWVLI